MSNRWPDLGYVLPTPVGAPNRPSDLQPGWVRPKCARASLRAVRPHDLRHRCVSVLLAWGGPPRTVMEIVGHSTRDMTKTVYGHVSLRGTRTALDQIGDLFEDGEVRSTDCQACQSQVIWRGSLDDLDVGERVGKRPERKGSSHT